MTHDELRTLCTSVALACKSAGATGEVAQLAKYCDYLLDEVERLKKANQAWHERQPERDEPLRLQAQVDELLETLEPFAMEWPDYRLKHDDWTRAKEVYKNLHEAALAAPSSP